VRGTREPLLGEPPERLALLPKPRRGPCNFGYSFSVFTIPGPEYFEFTHLLPSASADLLIAKSYLYHLPIAFIVSWQGLAWREDIPLEEYLRGRYTLGSVVPSTRLLLNLLQMRFAQPRIMLGPF
jgi:hypothetical protein